MIRDRKAPPQLKRRHRLSPGIPLLAVTAIGLAVIAGWSVMKSNRQHLRRYADHAPERRAPLSLFIAGDYPRRRRIDSSGAHPLFERRQAVYEAY